MGEFLSVVSSRANRPESLAHRISLRLGSSNLHALITEAGDDAFFYSALAQRLRLHQKFEFYIADGRPKVLAALRILNDMKKINRVYAIIDRDFNLSDPHTFYQGHCLVLDVYSFENYFLAHQTLMDIGVRFLSLEPGSEMFQNWNSIVSNFLDSLRDVLRIEHAIGYWCRKNNKNCNLNNFSLSRYVTIEESGALTRSDDLGERFILETNADLGNTGDNDIEACQDELVNLPLSVVIRGHYFWELFVLVLNSFRLKLDNQLRIQGGSRARTRSQISSRHALEGAVSVLDTPQVIEEFFAGMVA